MDSPTVRLKTRTVSFLSALLVMLVGMMSLPTPAQAVPFFAGSGHEITFLMAPRSSSSNRPSRRGRPESTCLVHRPVQESAGPRGRRQHRHVDRVEDVGAGRT